MELTYKVSDRPSFGKTIVYALQQLLAILAATIAVPTITGNGMSQSAALFGAGVGTLVYLLFTKFKSPAFLGSSFAFLGSMAAAFGGGVTASRLPRFAYRCGVCRTCICSNCSNRQVCRHGLAQQGYACRCCRTYRRNHRFVPCRQRSWRPYER